MKHSGKFDVFHGPLARVKLTLPTVLAARISSEGHSIPVKEVMLLVDTGAQSSFVENRLALALGLVPIRFQRVVGVSQQPQDLPVYRMKIVIGMEDHVGNQGFAEFESDIVGTNDPASVVLHQGLLGRDFLAHVRFNYDGPSGTYEIIDPRTSNVKPIRQNIGGRAAIDAKLQKKAQRRKIEKRKRQKRRR